MILFIEHVFPFVGQVWDFDGIDIMVISFRLPRIDSSGLKFPHSELAFSITLKEMGGIKVFEKDSGSVIINAIGYY